MTTTSLPTYELLAEVRLLHEVDAVVDALEVGARDVERDRVHRAGGDRDRVVVALELVERDVLADRRVEDGTSTPSRSTSRTSISIASRGRRNAGTPMSIVPPPYGRLSKTVTWKPFIASSRATAMPGRAGADDRDPLGARRDLGHDVGDARRLVPLHEEPLHRPDRERPVDVAAAAGPLARRGADVRAHRRDRVRLARQDVALLEPAFGGEVQVAAAVRPDRAGFLALDVALEPGGVDGLDEEFLVGVDRQGRGRAFRCGPVPGSRAAARCNERRGRRARIYHPGRERAQRTALGRTRAMRAEVDLRPARSDAAPEGSSRREAGREPAEEDCGA